MNLLQVATEWVRTHAARFNRAMVLQNQRNAGLALTRNAGFDAAETQYVLPLDADNRLLPSCVEACLEVAGRTSAAFVYPSIRYFGGSDEGSGMHRFSPLG